MITDLKPYAQYKSSGQGWLGDVPQHWSVLPNRALFAEVKDRNHPGEEMLSVTIARGVVRQKALLEGSSKKDSSNLDKSAYKLVQPRDIAYNKMRAWQGAIGASALRGIISPAYVVMRLRKDDDLPSYFHYLFRTSGFAKEAERWSYGITSDMWSLRPEHFRMIYTPEPLPAEQDAIVRFLDWAGGRLEQAIQAKKKVIALLNEQKQVMIHRAVTRGLDPSPTLKPSGLPWLGDFPQSWETRPLKQLLARIDYGTSENARGEGPVRVLTMGHIRDGRVILPRTGVLKIAPPGLLLEKNDLLFNRTNSADLVGKVGIFEGDAKDEVTFASYLVRLRVRQEHNSVWLNYLLNSTAFWGYARSHALLSLHQANLNSRRYGRMLLPVPSTRTEQDHIVEHIRIRAGRIERSVERLEREIELLREYRARLVADLVTGKLDVREAAAQLPQEAAPDVIPDDTESIEEPEPAEQEVV